MKSVNDPRHQTRQKVVQELFAWEAQQNLKGVETGKTPKNSLDPRTNQVLENLKKIDAAIQECAPEWEISKINQIDLAILRLAIFEMIFESTEPVKVVVDEAVELAKEFGNENSPSFINGALGKAFFLPQRVKKVIALTLGADEDKIVDEAYLITDLNGTALEVSDLITRLEKDYNFVLDATKIVTVADLLEAIEEQKE